MMMMMMKKQTKLRHEGTKTWKGCDDAQETKKIKNKERKCLHDTHEYGRT